MGWDEGQASGMRVRGSRLESTAGDRQHSLGCGGMFNPGRDGGRIALRLGLSPLHRPRNDPGRRVNGTGQRDGKSEASTALVRPVPPHPCRVGSHQRAPPDHRDQQVSTSLAPGTEHSACRCPSLREAAASFRHAGGNTNASSVLSTQPPRHFQLGAAKTKHLDQRFPSLS